MAPQHSHHGTRNCPTGCYASFGQFDSPLTSDGAVSGAYATDFTANWLSPSMNVNEIFFQAEDLRTWKP